MTDKQLNNRVKKMAELEAQKKELERQIGELKEELKKSMGDEVEVQTDKYVLKNTPYDSVHFDSKSFRIDHERLYRKFVTITQTTRFSWREL
jgi:predicted phage-related endonuclease